MGRDGGDMTASGQADMRGQEAPASRGAPSGVLLAVSVPFCRRRARWDTPALRERPSDDDLRAYAGALCQEMRALAPDLEGRAVCAIHIGGGTATLLPEGETARILDAARACFALAQGAEVLLEAQPGQLTERGLAEYAEAGVTRVNLLLPTTSLEELKAVDPPYDIADFKHTAWLMRRLEHRNFSVEVPLGLPFQTRKSFLDALLEAQSVGPYEIRMAPLVVRKGSRLADELVAGERLRVPSPDAQAKMWEAGARDLARWNYRQASMRSFPFPDHESLAERHRVEAGDVLGVGAGAATWCGGFCYRNTADVARYVGHVLDPGEVVVGAAEADRASALRRRVARKLESVEGVAPADLGAAPGQGFPEEVAPALRALMEGGLVEAAPGASSGTGQDGLPGRLAMTPKGAVSPLAFEAALGEWPA